MKKRVIALIVSASAMFLHADEGERLFKAYCWGCHHQTAEAFGPSFRTIASKRDRSEIIAQIVNPKGMYKILGYSRNSMPAFDDLKPNELEALADYIMKFKDAK
ncbi:c-type cytochrome [Hydrogenimonas sp.]